MRNKSALLLMLILAAVLFIAGTVTVWAQQPAKDEPPPAVYVVGYVIKPQAIPFNPNLTVSQAVAMAGGVTPDGGMERIRVTQHLTDNKRREIVVDLKAIAKRRAEDILLQPYDIVDVPSKESRKRRKKKCPQTPCVEIESIIPPKYLPSPKL